LVPEIARRRKWLIAAVMAVAVGAFGVTRLLSEDSPRFRWGISATARTDENAISSIQRLEGLLEQPLRSVRMYSLWDDPFPAADHLWLQGSGRMIVMSIKPLRGDGSIIRWAELADAPVGSARYNEMVGWARNIASFGDRIGVIFHHEPESKNNLDFGSALDFKRAWSRFVTITRAEGASNATFIWTMTDVAFTVAGEDRRMATLWYPGDEVVDAIGADIYNWYDCREGVGGTWLTFAELTEPLRQFGLLHPNKPVWLPEFGTVEDKQRKGRKGEWFEQATATLGKPEYKQFAGAIYFNHLDASFPYCEWWINSSPTSLAAFAAMGRTPLGLELADRD
jgi:hypothetical protein